MNLDAAIPLQSAQTDAESATTQYQQRREEATCTGNPESHCARKSIRNQGQSGATKTIAQASHFSPHGTSVDPQKHNVLRKSWNSNRIHDMTIPMRSANSGLQSAIRIVTSLIYPTLLFSSLLFPTLPYLTSNPCSTSTLLLPLHLPLLHLYSALLYPQLYCTILLLLTLLCPTPLSLRASTLLYLYSIARTCQLDTMIFGLV